ncbi:MAG: RluA family pseudouridine synthase [Verrucomicrobiota bacterium]
MGQSVKLSSPETGQFWEIPVLWEDDLMLALNKPAGLLVSPDRDQPARPNLMQLLHRGIERGAPWARNRGLAWLRNAHRLDSAATGVILLAKNRPALVALANQFGAAKPHTTCLALVRGSKTEDTFATDAGLAPHPLQTGAMRVDVKNGKPSRTEFTVRERFPAAGCLLLECRPFSTRTHQVRVHLKHLRLPIIGDDLYGGPPLLLSSLKPGYRLKPGHTERPLISDASLHCEQLVIAHPASGAEMKIIAPWPKDLAVAIKYLRRYAQPAQVTAPR